MHLSKEEFESAIKKTLSKNQMLLFVSVIISLSLFAIDQGNVYWSILFLAIGSVSLVAINNCKSDRKHFDSGQLKSTKGVLVDFFPENTKGERWILFIQEEATGKIVEITSVVKPEVKLQETYNALYTPKLNMLIKIS